MSEARIEHEWEYGSRIHRVRWCKGIGWSVYSTLAGNPLNFYRSTTVPLFVAAEIAKLAGLVPPGGEEEKG